MELALESLDLPAHVDDGVGIGRFQDLAIAGDDDG